MAIVEMKRISLLALLADKDRLLTAMQRMGCVEVTDVPEDVQAFKSDDTARLEALNARLLRLRWAIDRLKKYDTAGKVMFGCVPEVTQAQADEVLADSDEYFARVSQLEAFERTLGEMRGEEARTLAAVAQITPWQGFASSKAEIAALKSVSVFAGTMPLKNVDALKAALSGKPVSFEQVSIVKEAACVCVIAHVSCAGEVEDALKEADFTAESFALLNDDETPRQALESYWDKLSSIAKGREDIDAQMAQIAQALPQMKVLHDAMNIEVNRLLTAKRSAQTQSAFYLTGWVPAHVAQKVEKKLKSLSPSCSVEITDPRSDEEPPVELHNSRFATPFESVVEGFALPAYRGYDPTAIMAPFYACLFGMMVSDAGYGLIMALVIPLFIKWKKIKFENAKMMYLLTWGGVATVFWGLIYNTMLGFNPMPFYVLDPIKNSLPVMILCVAVGALHLFTGLGIAAWINFKKHDPIAAISDQIAWIVLLCGLVMLIIPQTAAVGQVMAIVATLIILLMAGRDRKNPFKRLMKGLSSLYGITSWIGDLLSYMRLFGMGLATGVIGMVFNELIKMVWNTGVIGIPIAIVLFVGCHLFNLAINVLGAYVHSCRLQYIEFFGKFYEEGGVAFKPLTAKTKYVSIKQDAA